MRLPDGNKTQKHKCISWDAVNRDSPVWWELFLWRKLARPRDRALVQRRRLQGGGGPVLHAVRQRLVRDSRDAQCVAARKAPTLFLACAARDQKTACPKQNAAVTLRPGRTSQRIPIRRLIVRPCRAARRWEAGAFCILCDQNLIDMTILDSFPS